MPNTSEQTSQKKLYPNIVKVRNDDKPLYFAESENKKFELQEGSEASWVSSEEFSQRELREHIEPWLTSLFQSEHLSLLAGSGLTHGVHYLAAGQGAAGMERLPLTTCQDKINAAAEASASQAGRKAGNVEDQLRVANELLRGLEILQDEQADTLREELEAGMKTFAESILKSETGIAAAPDSQREQAFNRLLK